MMCLTLPTLLISWVALSIAPLPLLAADAPLPPSEALPHMTLPPGV